MEIDQVLDAEFFSANRKRLRELFGGTAPIVISGNSLIQKSADSAYPFVQDSNFLYLTGIDEPGYCLVLEVDREFLIAPRSNSSRDIFEGKADEGALLLRSGIQTIIPHDEGWKQLEKRVKKVKHVATLQPPAQYIDQMDMYTNPVRAQLITRLKDINPDVSMIDMRPFLGNMRSVKSVAEIEVMKRAISETKRLYSVLEKKRKIVDTEYDLFVALEKERVAGRLEYAYEPIIASGPSALVLHYQKYDRKLDPSELLLVDLGLRYSWYDADITRTVVDKPTKRQQQVYEAVLAVQDFAFSLLKPGILMENYEASIEQFMGEKLRELGLIRSIGKEEVRGFYPHSTSHFLGIDAHDAGEYKNPLVPGMVLTVEPGIYIPAEGIGIRLEDDILITDDGNENLSKSIVKDIGRFA